MMNMEMLTKFFMWCTIIDGGLLVLWSMALMFAPTLVYRTQSKFFPLPRETFNVVIYCFVGGFKIVFLVFNLVPFIALSIIG